MTIKKTMTLDEEIAALLATANKDDEGGMIAADYDLTLEVVLSDKRDLSTIIADAKPFGYAGSISTVETEDAARKAAELLFILVSKHDYEGKKSKDGKVTVPAGTDWQRKGERTIKAVNEFWEGIIEPVSFVRWTINTGQTARSNFPFVKSVEYHFGNLRRRLLPTEVLKAHGLSNDSPNNRVTANRADLNVAVKNAYKALDGVQVYPKSFADKRAALDMIDKIKAECDRLIKNVNDDTLGLAPTGTEG
jgi:hypothetical protein